MANEIPNTIHTFFHCKRCIQEKPNGTSPREWMRLEVGVTPKGMQVWCVRHELNIANITFSEDVKVKH